MKSLGTILISLLSLPAAAQQPQLTRSLVISTPETEVKLGAPVTVTIVLKNTSDSKIEIARANAPKGSAELSYGVDVLDGWGKRVPYTKYGRRLRGQDPTDGVFTSYQAVSLRPNESLTDTVNLAKIYELDRPGQYVVQVTQWLDAQKAAPSSSVTSNAIKITIK